MPRYALDTFLTRALGNIPPVPTQAEVLEEGFVELRVRISQRMIEQSLNVSSPSPWIYPVLDIYRMRVKTMGTGTFSKLLARIKTKYPKLPILIEEVYESRFIEYLKRNGFEATFNVRLDVAQSKVLHSKYMDSMFMKVGGDGV